ncbi:MAG: hypothetical protein K6T65_11755 [Peptococcaceae bacterium]|nr:hypothetical protein [Peptococcaceae bacterium]
MGFKDLLKGGTKTPLPPEKRRPTLDVGALIQQGVFKSVEPEEKPPPQQGALWTFNRALDEALTFGLTRPGGVLDRVLEPFGIKPLQPYEPQTTAERAARTAGEVMGSLAPMSGLYGLARQGVTKLIPQAVSLPARIAKTTIPGATSFGAYEGITAATEGKSPEDIAKATGKGLLLGAGTELGLSALGAGLRALKRTRTPKIESLDFTKPPPPLPPPRPSFKTATPDYTIINARDFARGRGYSSAPEYGYPSGYLEAPARSGGTVETILPPVTAPESLISKPVPKTLRMPDYTKQAMAELEAGIQEAQNYIRHKDILAAYPPGTTVEQALADIKANTGIDLPQLMANAEKAMARPGLRQTVEQQAQYASLRRAAGLGPEKIGRTGQAPRPLGKMKAQRIEPQFPLTFRRTAEEPTIPTPKPFEKKLDFTTRGRAPEPIPPLPEPVKAPPKAAIPKVEPVKTETGEAIVKDATQLKDLGGWRLYMTDVYRNFRDVFGKQYDRVKKTILDPFDTSKKANIDFQEQWLTKLKTEVVDKLGIQRGSKESALVQDFGEGKITLDELKQKAPDKWQDIVKADKWFRQAYDQLIDEVNAVRRQIYPNVEKEMARIDEKIKAVKNAPRMKGERKGEKIKELQARKEEIMRNRFVPKRKDYYRHFRELGETFGGLRNIFDTPAQTSPALSGISEFTLPKSKWHSFMQKRGMGPYKSDAVGGFLNYIPSAGHAIYIDPHIGKFEKLADELAEATKDTANLNNFIEWLRDYSRDLAGKTNPVDRFLQKVIPGGRKAFVFIDWLNNRVKANVILGNAASTLAQLANIPHGLAYAKRYAVPGAGRTLKSIISKNEPLSMSGFMKERYGGIGSAMYRQFDTKLLEQPKKFAIWMMETADRIGTTFIWNSVYEKALAQGIKNPIKYADDVTRRMVAGRGIGEVPIVQKARIFQLLAPFQLEVANVWNVYRDFMKAKDFGALITLAVASFLFNRGIERIRGSGVTFDPIQAMIDVITKDTTPVQKAGRLAGEVLSNLPFGQTIAGLYPEYGTETLPTRKEFFGREDPTRFGGGLLLEKGFRDPFKLLPPFGGGQLKKTVGGIEALRRGGVYTQDGSQLKYPISPDTANRLKGVLFGPSGFREAREYYEENRRPLSEKQTEQLKRLPSPEVAYEQLQFKRRLETIDRQIAEVRKDKKLSQEEKNKAIQDLMRKRQELIQKRGS